MPPPGPAYNWFCVLYSAAQILGHAARYKTAQITAAQRVALPKQQPRKRRRVEDDVEVGSDGTLREREPVSKDSPQGVTSPAPTPTDELPLPPPEPTRRSTFAIPPSPPPPQLSRLWDFQANKSKPPSPVIEDIPKPAPPPTSPTPDLAPSVPTPEVTLSPLLQTPTASNVLEFDITSSPEIPRPTRTLKSSKVPSSRIGRLFHYGGLAASLGYGAASELIRRTGSSETELPSVMMTEANIKRLVSKLSQMRGAALKLGQFLSIQDSHILPPDVDEIFRRVQDGAHYMPDWQMETVMTSAFGKDWLANFDSFDRIPFAAASIGQVHRAVLSASVSPTGQPERVAVKVQFPNIVNSIDSDLGYIKVLLAASRILPKGLFLDKTISVMKEELADECDYVREASFLRRFSSPSHLGNDPRFGVPWVWDKSASNVLVMQHMDGISLGSLSSPNPSLSNLSQQDRNDISESILELCLRELFEFRAMQTDPNWTNFLWNGKTRQVELVDFGATRTYSKTFMDMWYSLLNAAAEKDREGCIHWSRKLGYLTGEENEIMLDAHISSISLLATPFMRDTPQPFAFGPNTPWAEITAKIRDQIPIMLRHRLTPPPRETYSLNRKLSGAFLLASRLGATVDTRRIWEKIVGKYVVDESP